MDNFPGLRAGENILFFVRKHWAAYLRIFFKLAIHLTVMFVLLFFLVEEFDHSSVTYFLLIEVMLFYLLGMLMT